ncbi:hypothetical protein CANMA_002480 [Candida margitis]|uniref:uncharacterized protein n=1 Tax=Candida margitis TaxID=1775924 RepID=UPI002226AE3D|nr:uncharacterized protein CANMA_002480 [Candida margitis]KAI5968264.1 hypothetical protein CANMA_002480 [Candida margitis]
MLVNYAIALLLYFQLGFALLIPHVLKPRIFSLRSTKQRLQATINPLVPTRKYQKDFSIHSILDGNRDDDNSGDDGAIYTNRSGLDNDNFVIIPKELINPTMFSTLGLNKLFNLTDNLDKGHNKWMNFSLQDQIFIPHEFKTYFIFNTSLVKQSLGLDMIHKFQQQQQQQQQQLDQNAHYSSNTLHKFLSRVVPFDMPELVELVDYYMVLPNLPQLHNLTSSIYHEGLLGYPMDKLPVFRTRLSENKPLIVFMFNETDATQIDEFSSSSLSMQSDSTGTKKAKHIMSIKNYLKSPTTFSTFFDTFAKNWIHQVDYDSLIHSVFCNVNNHDEDHSFCLRVRQQMVDIVPAFQKFIAKSDPNVVVAAAAANEPVSDTAASLLKHDDGPIWEDVKVESQAVKQVHDKLQAKKHALTMAGTAGVNLIRYPKDTLHKLDDFIDEKIDNRLNKIDDKKDSLLDSIDDKKYSFLGSIDDKRDSVLDSIVEKKSAIIGDGICSSGGYYMDDHGKFKSAIDDKRHQITDLIQRKSQDLQMWKFKPQLFEKKTNNKGKSKSRLTQHDHPALYSDYSDGDEDGDRYGYKTDGDDEEEREYIHKRNFVIDDASLSAGVGDYVEEGGFSLPLSLLNYQGSSTYHNNNANYLNDIDGIDEDVDDNGSPRKTTYSQVMNLDTLNLKKKRAISDNDGDENIIDQCQPITWYNIFHRSIFGEPNFCNDQ